MRLLNSRESQFQGEVLNFGYHLGLGILNTGVRLYLGLNDHRVSKKSHKQKSLNFPSNGRRRPPEETGFMKTVEGESKAAFCSVPPQSGLTASP